MDENVQIKSLEAELLRRLAEGDDAAFERLFYMYKDKLYRFLLQVTHSKIKAEDVIQDVFLKLWQDRISATAIQNLNAYLFRAAQNHVIDELRRFSRQTLSLSEYLDLEECSDSKTPVDALITKELREKLSEAVRQLPPQQQKIFTLHKEEGISHAEIARQLNLSVSTIQNHMRQALINLRHYLSHAYPGLFMLFLSGFMSLCCFFLKK